MDTHKHLFNRNEHQIHLAYFPPAVNILIGIAQDSLSSKCLRGFMINTSLFLECTFLLKKKRNSNYISFWCNCDPKKGLLVVMTYWLKLGGDSHRSGWRPSASWAWTPPGTWGGRCPPYSMERVHSSVISHCRAGKLLAFESCILFFIKNQKF